MSDFTRRGFVALAGTAAIAAALPSDNPDLQMVDGKLRVRVPELLEHPQSLHEAFAYARFFYRTDPTISAAVDAEVYRLTAHVPVRGDRLRFAMSLTHELVLLGQAHLYASSESDELLLLPPEQVQDGIFTIAQPDRAPESIPLDPECYTLVHVGDPIFRQGDGYALIGIPDDLWNREDAAKALHVINTHRRHTRTT